MSEMREVFDQTFCEKVSRECVKKFNGLGKNGKPGKNEWTVLACVVKSEKQRNGHHLEVVSLGTGSKCIGGSELPKNGDRLHDSHAEIIAKRAFKLYLLHQLKNSFESRKSIFYLEKEGFSLKGNISFHFYCSNVPCGDASIFPKNSGDNVGERFRSDTTTTSEDNCTERGEPLAKKRKVNEEIICSKNSFPSDSPVEVMPNKIIKDSDEDMKAILYTDLHRTGAKCAHREESDPKEAGLNYHVTGVLRTKPGRGDRTLSHCCSDKMFKWTVLGVQGALLMLFLNEPIYLKTITIGSASPFDYDSLHRALYFRFRKQLTKMDLILPFRVQTPKILHSRLTFPHTKINLVQNDSGHTELKPSSASIIWSDTSNHINKPEVSVDGKRLGTTKKNENSIKSRVSICRMELLRKVFELLNIMKTNDVKSYRLKELLSISVSLSYANVKEFSVPYESMWDNLCNCILVHWMRKPNEIKDFVLDGNNTVMNDKRVL